MGLFCTQGACKFQRKRQQHWRLEAAATRGEEIATGTGDFVPAGLATLTGELDPVGSRQMQWRHSHALVQHNRTRRLGLRASEQGVQAAIYRWIMPRPLATTFRLNSCFFLVWFRVHFKKFQNFQICLLQQLLVRKP